MTVLNLNGDRLIRLPQFDTKRRELRSSIARCGYLLVFGQLVFQACNASAAEARRTNILFIYTDDHSYRTLSCYEGAEAWVRTPNIDRLAARGVRFTHAYIGSWCMPSRATMLTGLQQYGVQTMRMVEPYPNSTYDPARCRFWPAEFRRQGYQTAHIGKWHTGTDAGFGRDWDFQIVWNRPKHPENAPNYYYDQMLSFNGGEPKIVPGYSTDNYTRWAVEYIKGAHRDLDKPWYLWLCYASVHSPYTPAERHLADYPGASVPTPADIYPPRAGKPEYMQRVNVWKPGRNGEPVLRETSLGDEVGDQADRAGDRTLSDWVRQYNQAVRALDEGIGQVLAALEESGEQEELYDLESDPDELTNLALDAEHAATLRTFRALAVSELKRTGAKMAEHLPAVKSP